VATVEKQDKPYPEKRRKFASIVALEKYIREKLGVVFSMRSYKKEEARRCSGPKVGPTTRLGS
jgi:hypothetical protein